MERSRFVWLLLGAAILGCDMTSPDTSGDAGLSAPVYDAGGSATGEDSGSGDSGGAVLVDSGAGCASNTDCATGELCAKHGCDDSPTGTCVPRPTEAECKADQSGSACGCDHITYPNDCWAAGYGENVFAEGQCVLPAGACRSQSDCGGAAYATAVFCAPSGCGETAGTCTPIPGACEYILDKVCGCDGETYYNECFARLAKVTMAYGGPCRSESITFCNDAADCASGEACVSDPRGCDGASSCPGVCLASAGPCCSSDPSSGSGSCGAINSPRTQECVASACAEGSCASCVFTTGVACTPEGPCPAGELCVPSSGPSGGSFCVMP
jgi:hypothetical protein